MKVDKVSPETNSMNSQPGYYSLIQFCPDRSRLEAANVGVLLFCSSLDYLDLRLSEDCERIQRFFGKNSFDSGRVEAIMRAFAHRLRSARPTLKSVDALDQFRQTQANALLLTPLRPVKIKQADDDLKALFSELVEDQPQKRERPRLLLPELDKVFKDLAQSGRAQLSYRVRLPLLGKVIRFPYAYENGIVNLIKPQRFPSDENRATGTAMRLAIEGDQVAKHGAESDGRDKQVVVVADFGNDRSRPSLSGRILNVLHEYRIKTVTQQELPVFIDQVRREAH